MKAARIKNPCQRRSISLTPVDGLKMPQLVAFVKRLSAFLGLVASLLWAPVRPLATRCRLSFFPNLGASLSPALAAVDLLSIPRRSSGQASLIAE